MGKSAKSEIVTFKADAALLRLMRGMPNRSEFIRAAILAAMDSVCPLCNGTGIMTPNQREHWKAFAEDHSIETCDHCEETRLVCGNEGSGERRRVRVRKSPRRRARGDK